ncbi:adenine phosphoribosyltransferase [Mobilicoccus pelagius]|uniref:Adenine phosphoribosyltransferase n=1 Tax=Mobilicoccus pelagius NBRC 104925 TaxID=1089455 RepID=H5UPF4_9MICO|nr:adenine phosphoribosyltransferase [Mobilicoccus pelagius]GAB47612.1 adenine phosphoribosyltransferase [Mobilicoccus pelagius NBRC 104925]
MTDSLASLVSSRLRDIPDFPAPGVLFKDFTPLLADPRAFAAVVDDTAARYRGRVDAVVGIEARGFMIGAATAYALGVGFVPVRKQGKLPAETESAEYSLEYGTATIEIHRDAFAPGARVLVMDDVIATGGTLVATCDLVERLGGKIAGVEVVVEIASLGGRATLGGRPLTSMLLV